MCKGIKAKAEIGALSCISFYLRSLVPLERRCRRNFTIVAKHIALHA